MDGEIYFRKSAFGGFNRDDVMCYISELKLKCEAQKEQCEENACRVEHQIDVDVVNGIKKWVEEN